jgi:hypothetical protein
MTQTSRSTLPTAAALLACLALGGCGDGGASAGHVAGQIDDVCASAQQCAAEQASCIDIGDGAKRCEASCLGDKACGAGAACLFNGGASVGECFRMCETPVDCASPNWGCEQIVSSSAQAYCVPPCRLSACTASSFDYNCGSGSYTSDLLITGGTTSSTITYGNGHTVRCQSTGGHGQCSDDTGASCTF